MAGVLTSLAQAGFDLGDSAEAVADTVGHALGYGVGVAVIAVIFALARNHYTRS